MEPFVEALSVEMWWQVVWMAVQAWRYPDRVSRCRGKGSRQMPQWSFSFGVDVDVVVELWLGVIFARSARALIRSFSASHGVMGLDLASI